MTKSGLDIIPPTRANHELVQQMSRESIAYILRTDSQFDDVAAVYKSKAPGSDFASAVNAWSERDLQLAWSR